MVITMTNKDGCAHLEDILKTELKIIKRHLKEHKWYQHIENDNDGMIDFIDKYAFIMRDYYCEYICPDKDTCEISPQYKENENSKTNKEKDK